MKKSKLFTLSLIIIATLGGCSNFIEIEPQGQESSDTFLNTEANAYSAVNGMYDLLQQTEGPGPDGLWMTHHYDFFMGSLATDDAESRPGDFPELAQLASFTLTGSNSVADAFWIHGFWAVSRANYLINKLPTSPINENLKDQMLGEAHFFRGYYYSSLLKHFGGVPLLSEPVSTSQFGKIERASIHETIEFIKNDLKIAAAKLPERSKYPQTDLGRFTAGAAKAYLARIILYQLGVDSEGTATWQDAYNATDAIVKSGEYSLVPNYATLFEYENKNSTESILEIQSSDGAIGDQPGSVGTAYALFQGNRNAKGDNAFGGWGFHSPTQDLASAFDPSDPRLSSTIYGIGYNSGILYGVEQNYKRSDQGSNYFNRKVTLPFKPTLDKAAPQDIILMRYADVLLMHAEACYHIGKIADAQQYLNMVRTRARNSSYCKGYIAGDANSYSKPATTPNIPNITTQGQPLLDAIYNERRIELALEGYRAWDLIRMGKFVAAVSKVKDTDRVNNGSGDETRVVGIKQNIELRSITGKGNVFIPVLPIPLSEIQNWHLIQNPNY